MNENVAPSTPLILSENSISYLNTTRKWAKFLSILGFVFTGLFLLIAIGLIFGGLFVGSIDESPFPLVLLGLIYFVMSGVYLIPIWYLFKFSKNLEKMYLYRDNFLVEEAFRYQMAFYRFIGIFTIVILAIYLVLIIIGLLAGFGYFMSQLS
ncbi:hypothetical protein C7377_0029 [Balneicella halophila]|uniref:DUF5362 domain-containing protein n=1 Tax=Balneicella halophila TaxID=1537566 RepID=A0A7L4US20_BALHA|nr:hypothetical protein [Balneicella halophila]PVX51744.1 hypothetical protein C7377_0029 [Balneicella halophila]